MRVRQADFEANVLRLDRSKNGEGREVTMTPTIRLLLAECARGKRPDDFLFSRADGKPVKSFRDAWKKMVAAAGVPELTLHDLRRTAVRNMVRAGIPEKTAMMISGHRTRDVFERYNITDQRDIKQAVARLENDPRFDPYSPETGSKAEPEKRRKPQ
jgi:integrase